MLENARRIDRIGCLEETRAWLSARGLEVFEHPVCLDSVTRGVRVRHEAGGRAVDALNGGKLPPGMTMSVLFDQSTFIENAIAEVYASVFHPDPIEYRRSRGLIDFQEQMGILIQEVVGQSVGDLFFPAFAGVAFSRCEMRWSPRIRHTDGMARLVLGLGTRAVDRTCDDYPVLVALEQPTLRAVQQPDEVYRYSQGEIDVIDLSEGQFNSVPIDAFLRRVGRKVPNMNRIFSIYRDRQILPMVGLMVQVDPSELVVTFDGLVKSDFPASLKSMLDLLEEGLGEPVDVEAEVGG